ncbi:MAG: cation-binding protein [Desulfurococcaceae archaeon]|nr:MAG: cation-binding protein [Desulfurococcaceae archaeon]
MHRIDVGGLIFVLREHHERILEALEILEQALSTENPDPEDILKLIRFAQHFVDSCHHSIEERILFSSANRSGFPLEGGPISVMVCEHGVGRYLTRIMEELYLAWRRGDEKAREELAQYAKIYIDHLSQHINKENMILFPMLESSLPEASSSKSVEQIENESEHEKWISILEELKKKYRTHAP